MQTGEYTSRWYQNFWAWFYIGILLLSITVSTSLLVIAIKYGDNLVVDNYYDVGKGINRSIEREELAKRLEIIAEVTLDAGKGEALLDLKGKSSPPFVVLNLISPTQPEKDIRIVLQPAQGSLYRGTFSAQAPEGRRFIELLGTEAQDQWRLYEQEIVTPGKPILLGE